ncbi:site-2 protease family protein [Flavobacterium crassostreae]|uniref:Peptidase M50 domain-containing protein n=1 Tax=Flavobacterium crassostreae TaxID=1763534 RepID=A0A1B9E908_9FLAO|nr:site-2 protease family protein [Flavobacterium crassostreae]OCB78450.1 hypothetical protein LPBF_02195 [Flavobacterium crassostreae]
MYSKIEIYDTDFKDKYLLKLEDKTMYVGFLIKEIVELLKESKTINQIINILNKKYQITLNEEDINEIITNKINNFLSQKQPTTLVKLFKILEPSKFIFPSFVTTIFDKKIFYSFFSIVLLINLFFFFTKKNQPLTTTIDWLIWSFLLIIVLILHELGHTVSAQKFNVKVHELGFGIYSIFPVFYVDLGESWKLNIEKRTIINFSGIFIQLILGCFFYILYLIQPEDPIFTHIFHANFFIIILNLNPFLKFDGYWIISDLLNEKNLMEKSNNILKKIIAFKKVKEKQTVIFYSVFRLLFIIWLIYIIANSTFKFILKLINNDSIKWNDFIPIVLLTYFIYRMLKNKFKKS